MVGNRTGSLYGAVIGQMDPTPGTFVELMMVVLADFGVYDGVTGRETFKGVLVDEGQVIDGTLTLVLGIP